MFDINPLSTNFTKLSNTLKQFVGKLPTNCLSVFDHFVGLPLEGLMSTQWIKAEESSLFRGLTSSIYVIFYVFFFFSTNEDVTENN